jgi:hypothetical protein
LQIELVSLEHPKQKLFFNLHEIPNSVNLINRNETNGLLEQLIIMEQVLLKPVLLPIYKNVNANRMIDFSSRSLLSSLPVPASIPIETETRVETELYIDDENNHSVF